jgi:hypothetical protein
MSQSQLSLLWVTIEPGYDETRLLLTCGETGAVMRARLPPVPMQPRALAMLLEGLSAYFGQSLTAVVDATVRGGGIHPNQWARLLDEIDSEQVRVQWVVAPGAVERDRFLKKTRGDFSVARRLLTFAATGLK